MKTPQFLLAGLLLVGFTTPVKAQLGKQQGLVEPNIAADSTLLKLPGMTPKVVTALKESRPLLSMITLDSILGAQGLTREQRTTLYGKLFVHDDLNRASDAELMLIPGMDARKLATLKAGRPWKDFNTFATTFGKATTPAEALRVEQYLFIPIALNSFTDQIMDTFSSIGVGTSQWKREFAEYRPWTTMEQFDRNIGKYLRSRPEELKRLRRYVIIDKP